MVLSSVLQVLVFPLPGLSFLAWLALAPLIVALLRTQAVGELVTEDGAKFQAATPAQGFLLAYASGIVWYAGTCYWIFDTMRQYGGLSAVAAAFALLLFCLYLGLYHGFFGLFLGFMNGPGRDHRRALVTAPFLWVAMELARTRITGFPWNLLGTSQVDNNALSRIATATGVYGISLEIMLVNIALAAAFLVPRKKRRPLLIAALAAGVVLQAGSLIESPGSPADRDALLVQQNIPVSADWTARDYFASTLNSLVALSLRSANSNDSGTAGKALTSKSPLIVWPESPSPFQTNDPSFRKPVSEMARRAQSWVVSGSIGVEPATHGTGQSPRVFNSAALISPQGEWTARYDKVHLVPFGEYLPFPSLFSFAGGLTREVGEFQHGESRAPLDAGGEKLGVFICYESVFPDEVRQFANNGAQVFVNISNDGWYGDSGAYAQHLNQTRMRAVENERWLLSATDTGVTASIDPLGRIVARLPRKERAVLVAPYALSSVTTFYTRHGDWFAYACAIIFLGALTLHLIAKNQKRG
jgi:apolipoprotein N-acyltransferase